MISDIGYPPKEKVVAFNNTLYKDEKLRYLLSDIVAYSTAPNKPNVLSIRLRHFPEVRLVEFKSISDKNKAIDILDNCFDLIKG